MAHAATANGPVLRAPSARRALALSAHDRVYGGLAAGLVLLGALVLLLFLVWMGGRPVSKAAPIGVQSLQVEEGPLGGFEHGVLNETIELPGPITGGLGRGEVASEDSIQETLTAVAAVVAQRTPELTEPFPSAETRWSIGKPGGSDGTGDAPARGIFDRGTKGGASRAKRWLIEFDRGLDSASYAKQLDFFKIELAAIGGGSDQIEYAFALTKAKPDRRTGSSDKEQRLYFSWRDGALQQADRDLLTAAGIEHEGRIVVQFFSPITENWLAFVEMDYLKKHFPGRNIKTVRQTKFKVIPVENYYEFVVAQQTYFGG